MTTIITFNFLIFGLPWWGLFYYGFTTTFDTKVLGPRLSIGIETAAIWIFLGPLVILLWENQYLLFIKDIMRRPKQSQLLDRQFRHLIIRHSSYACIWGLSTLTFTMLFFYYSIDIIKPYTTFFEHPPILIATLLVLGISGYSIGYGFSGVFQAMSLFKGIDVLRLEWMPFHHDQKGGFRFLASFALATTFAISSGSVVLPATMGIALKISNGFVWAIYAFTSFYVVMIAATFIYPMYKTAMIANKEKNKELLAVSKRLTPLYRNIMHLNKEPRSAAPQTDLDQFDKYRTIEERLKAAPVLPVGIGTILKLLSATSLPVNIMVTQIIKWDKVVHALLPNLRLPFQ